MLPNLWLALFAAFVVSELATLVTTLYLHRTLSHRALALSPGVTAACRVLTWITTGIRPRQWVAVHRKHHAYTDVEGDPHSPVLLGVPAVQFGNVALYRRVAKDEQVVTRYARDLPPDAWDRVFFDHALFGLAIGIAILCLLFGLWLGLLAAAVHTVVYLMMSAAINALGHAYGYQSNPNTAHNLRWLAWLTVGEGLHNNHHAAPTSARFSFEAGEIDPGWWVVRLLQRTGRAVVRHDGPVLKVAS